MTSAEPTPTPVTGIWLGRMGFGEALQRQLDARDALAAGEGPPILFAVEHPPALTLGRRGARSDVLWSDAQLSAMGVTVHPSPRGGQVTLHAPGQLVVYPVVRIGWRIRRHITQLGEAAAELLRELGVEGAAFRIDNPGVWVGEGTKLASIGVHVSRGVTVQGIAINLAVDPRLFGALVSCGMAEVRMASVDGFGLPVPAVADAARRYGELWAAQYGAPVTWAPAAERAGASTPG